jgi:hypothetical protein
VAEVEQTLQRRVGNLKRTLAIWDVEPKADNTIVGGHAVVLAGYNASGAWVISWGQYDTMTWAFFEKFVDEAYAITDPLWTK